jgi:Uma2 family endonuclease
MEIALDRYQKEHEPDHTQLPESDGSFVKNFQEHPQSLILTSSIEPVLQKLHPDGQYCIGQDSGIYWRRLDPSEDPLKGCEAPDWFYVPNVPPFLRGEHRRSYVMWIEKVVPLIAIEFVSGNGEEERDKTPWETIDPKTNKIKKPGKFWVYEQGIQIPFYGIYEVKKASVEVYRLVSGQYEKMLPNHRNHYEIEPMGVELGIRYGSEEPPVPWLRWWDKEGNLLLTGSERAAQAEILAERERLIASQERLARQEAETIAAQERLAKQEAETIAAQERQQKEQERLAKQQAEATAQAEQTKNEKLVAYLRSIGVDPEAIL